jgi:1-acyl-sn-glycerol-3-phosphate acyltransferase
VPLIPVALWGTQRLWTKGRPRTLTRRHVPVTILIGEPLHPQPRDKHEEVNVELRKRIQELLDQAQQEYPEKPKDDELWWQPAHLGGAAPTPEEAAALDANGREE